MSKKKKIKTEPEVKESESQEEEPKKEESKSDINGREAFIDINLTYRKGDIVPQEVIDRWEKENGIDTKPFFGDN